MPHEPGFLSITHFLRKVANSKQYNPEIKLKLLPELDFNRINEKGSISAGAGSELQYSPTS